MDEFESGKEILEPYNLHFSDLVSLSSPSPLPSNETERLEGIAREVMEALGPTGPGLLAITGVPNASYLWNTLLPLARDLSLLDNDLRNRILKDHGLGSDVRLKNLDRNVSSFAMQLRYKDGTDASNLTVVTTNDRDDNNSAVESFAADGFSMFVDNHFKCLGSSFRDLGLCMMDLGLRVARVCDRAIGGNELEWSLLESGTAKGRLIHYHSALDTCIIKESGRRFSKKRETKLNAGSFPYSKDVKSCRKSDEIQRNGSVKLHEKNTDLWQQWHYDYGTFTVLTSPMFMQPRFCKADNGEDVCLKFGGVQCPSPSGHTYLQILDPSKDNICIVKAPSESFILQVGESADILSRSKLRSTLHSVLRPTELETLSRETFVVFLHPAWYKVFDISDYPMEQLTPNGQEKSQGDKEELKKVKEEIRKMIPPLSSRLKDGMTFAEFSQQTTKQYYGGNGLQASR